jgi:chromosome segregation ATPase
MIKEMEQRLVVGGNALGGEQNPEEKERLRQQRALQIKLRNERKKQKQLMEDKQKKEEQLLLQQQQYSSLQEEVEQNRKIIEKLRAKYTQINKELRDVREEAEEHKEGMLDTIREQEREVEFLNLVTRALLKDFELQNLREKSRYDEFNQRWVLPVFYVKERAIQLPKVGIRNADSLISQELDKRDFIIQGSE